MKMLNALFVNQHAKIVMVMILIIALNVKMYCKSLKMECAVKRDVRHAIKKIKQNVQAAKIVISL